jgi:hypothetical protein
MEDYTEIYEAVAALVNKHFNGDIEEAGRILDALGGHGDYSSSGIEYVAEKGFNTLLYLNMGDTYAMTIMCQEGTNHLFVSTWSDWYEEEERAHCDDNGVIRCNYCGGFTPLSDLVHWSDILCEHCNNLVGG